MPIPSIDLSKKLRTMETPSIMQEIALGNLRRVLSLESDREVIAAALVLSSLQYGEIEEEIPHDWWSTVPRKKKTPRIRIDDPTHESPECSARRNPAKRKFRDSSSVILEEGCEMPEGEVPEWVEARVRELGGSHARLVVQKNLFNSDVTSGQSRFSIPAGRVVHGFLTREELESLDREDKITVSLIQPCGKTCELLLGKWRLSSSSSYVLTRNWTSVWKEPRNGMEKGVAVQLWSYRVEGKLCLWLVKVEDDHHPVQDLLD